jgi:hypothetical protein
MICHYILDGAAEGAGFLFLNFFLFSGAPQANQGRQPRRYAEQVIL